MSDFRRHNDQQIEYFSSRPLPRMVTQVGGATPYVARHVDAVITAGRLDAQDQILDVGCGPGKYTVALAEAGLQVEGVDLTPGLAAQLRESAPDLSVHVGDLMDPPEDLRGRFDAVTGFFMLHHIVDLDAALEGTAALLRPRGRAVFCEPNPYFPGYYAQILLTPGMTWEGDGGIVQMRPKLLRRAASRAGFATFHTHRFGAFPPALANRALGRRIERAVEAVPGWRWGRAFQIFTVERRP